MPKVPLQPLLLLVLVFPGQLLLSQWIKLASTTYTASAFTYAFEEAFASLAARSTRSALWMQVAGLDIERVMQWTF